MSDVAEAPKRRNWLVRIVNSRDFTRDIIVTTLGVLIALGIGAIVDAISWRLRLRAIDNVMKEEFGVVRGTHAYHLLSQDCVSEKFASLFEILDAARISKDLPDIRGIGFTGDFGSFGDSWELARSNEAILRMPPAKAMEWAGHWVNVRYQTDAVTRQRESFEELGNMAGRPGPVTVEQIDQWLAVMLRAVRANEVVVSFALRDDAEFEKLGVKRIGTNGKPFDLKRASAEYRNLGICKPLMVDGKVYRPKVPRESIRKMLPKDLVG